ncbi:MAG TPA: N-acetyl-gamma-glutamyl-phosphate reductase [Acidimicrobiales bacterium]|nr:N-acetyl-gamma-glutamyl-phosphate reductase [Acidimicrobiales bacterium]
MPSIGIVGASGFAGAELLRLASGHPEVDVAWATGDSQAGAPIAGLYPNLAAVVGARTFERYSPDMSDDVDAVVFALPHGASGALVPEARTRTKVVLDLGADFRLRDPALYPAWYGAEHPAPEQLDDFVYGLPELHRTELAGATAVAVPGCYPTVAVLALHPFVKEGLVEPTGIVVDAATGVSGAGRDKFPFCNVDEDFSAYGLLNHRHTPEMEQELGGAQVLFTPHLAPMNRGILATCYARPTGATSTAAVLDVLRETYDGEPFVVVTDDPPSTKATMGANTCHVTARYDERTGWVVVIAAIDNLVKGTSGQALQCLNLAFGIEETLGLPRVGLLP